jgi:hypothetical protein
MSSLPQSPITFSWFLFSKFFPVTKKERKKAAARHEHEPGYKTSNFGAFGLRLRI